MSASVFLRPVQPADLPIFYEQQLDPEAVAMAAFPSRDRKTFMQHWAKILADNENVTRCIVADGEIAGNIACFEWQGHKEVGYWLGKAYWGRGIATRALAILLQQVTERPLMAMVVRHNVASLRVLQKCGFKIVATVLAPDNAMASAEAPDEYVLQLA
ncbi:MAG: GNAT family N-acetyltransferase [Anaerolineae bacterium]|nr:GNAT family N-acetyltransferase [Anaerolineae bacterium]